MTLKKHPVDDKSTCAVDASESSVRITTWALQNLIRKGDSVHILHVIPAAPARPATLAYGSAIIMSVPFVTPTMFEDATERQATIREVLTKRFSDLFHSTGTQCST